jgi:hypothetical protein
MLRSYRIIQHNFVEGWLPVSIFGAIRAEVLKDSFDAHPNKVSQGGLLELQVYQVLPGRSPIGVGSGLGLGLGSH